MLVEIGLGFKLRKDLELGAKKGSGSGERVGPKVAYLASFLQ